MGIAFGAGLFNEIQVFNAIQRDEKDGHQFSSQGMIIISLYLLSISCKFEYLYI